MPNPECPPTRPSIRVAAGILIDTEGAVLLTTRVSGQVYAHHWEFPGGKVEAGESPEAALVRELQEELGIEVQPSQTHFWKTQQVDYPHASIELYLFLVQAWAGPLQMRQGQTHAWQQLPVELAPLLKGAALVLDDLAIMIKGNKNHLSEFKHGGPQ